MKIYGGHDYYDGGMIYHDDSIVFVRKDDNRLSFEDAEKHGILYDELNCGYEDKNKKKYSTYSAIQIEELCVIVCGKKYNGIRITFNKEYGEGIHYVWSYDELVKVINNSKLSIRENRKTMYRKFKELNPDEYFDPQELKQESINFLIDNKISILNYIPYGMQNYWLINPSNLKEYQFYKVLSVPEIFQELEMWLGGVLSSTGNPMIVITDDKIKIAKHGFDSRSFRKDKV